MKNRLEKSTIVSYVLAIMFLWGMASYQFDAQIGWWTAWAWLLNSGYSISTVLLAFGSFIFVDKIFFPQFDTMEELKRGNLAISVFVVGYMASVVFLIGKLFVPGG